MNPTSLNAAPGAEHVAILMGTWQGDAHLAEQLESIAGQSHAHWTLWVSDDGSTDGTLQILRDYRLRWGDDRLKILHGPARGFQANFLSLACDPAIHADFYAYADQDDIWEADKLARSLAWLRPLDGGTPAMYCARTRLVDEHGDPIGMSWLFTRPPSFRNALVQSIGGGNTMLINRATIELMRRMGPDLAIVNHDWWTYLVVTGCGGRVVYDPHPTLRYRQHGSNAVGANLGPSARLRRVGQLLRGRLREWNDRNLAALDAIRPFLSSDSVKVIEEYRQARRGSLWRRARHLIRSGVHRQHFSGNAGLVVALLFDQL